MSVFTEKYRPDQLPPDDLSEREKQLVQVHLNSERVARWRKLAGPRPFSLKALLADKKWIWWAVAVIFVTSICWLAGWFSISEKRENQAFAARPDLVEYPFENIAVRGERDPQKIVRSVKVVEAYRKNDFETALRVAAPEDHFLVGVCWLQLKNAEKALTEFEQVAMNDGSVNDEFFYYKGAALQDLGRREEAIQAFQRVLESKTVRERFRADAAKRMKN